MLMEQKPWAGKNRLEIVAQVGYNRECLPAVNAVPPGCAPGLAKLVNGCCVDDPKDRPSFGKILRKLEHMEREAAGL